MTIRGAYAWRMIQQASEDLAHAGQRWQAGHITENRKLMAMAAREVQYHMNRLDALVAEHDTEQLSTETEE